MGLRSAEKFVPDAIFGLDDKQLARFLGGHVCLRRARLLQ